jgi:hypothetical protein
MHRRNLSTLSSTDIDRTTPQLQSSWKNINRQESMELLLFDSETGPGIFAQSNRQQMRQLLTNKYLSRYNVYGVIVLARNWIPAQMDLLLLCLRVQHRITATIEALFPGKHVFEIILSQCSTSDLGFR